MESVSALLVDSLDQRQVPGPAARFALLGVMFSMAAPSPAPVTIAPHLVVLVRCRPDEPGNGVLEVVFTDESGEEVARNASPFTVEPGKFTYRLVRGELTFPAAGTVEARCRIGQGPVTVVPLT